MDEPPISACCPPLFRDLPTGIFFLLGATVYAVSGTYGNHFCSCEKINTIERLRLRRIKSAEAMALSDQLRSQFPLQTCIAPQPYETP
ncbi:hypothetical protein J2W40_001536 [Sphingobium xenophagum]|uniref:Uncharacterized protein n=1 Tax=Sphingobium xenophagum TaxID=121428 RepID=A0ABU1WZG6_SPHXE|nr:hypothetical protein [Sphingobium xenophagum]MDR7154721.1 hypothetical protein [Sphingobium xenophagum]